MGKDPDVVCKSCLDGVKGLMKSISNQCPQSLMGTHNRYGHEIVFSLKTPQTIHSHTSIKSEDRRSDADRIQRPTFNDRVRHLQNQQRYQKQKEGREKEQRSAAHGPGSWTLRPISKQVGA